MNAIKVVRTKLRNISSLSAKCPHWLNPPLFVRTHHKFRKIRGILHQKVRKSASEKNPSSLTASVFGGQWHS